VKVGRILFGPKIDSISEPMLPTALLIETAKARIYRDGLAGGVVLALKALLGDAPAGAEPYRGPIPDELRLWAEAALTRAEREAA